MNPGDAMPKLTPDEREQRQILKRIHARKPRATLPTSRRECLKCGKSFKSTGPGNRLCMRCNIANAAIYQRPVHHVGDQPGTPAVDAEWEPAREGVE